MILDSSAVVAILLGEPEAEPFAALVEAVSEVAISAATLVELSMVLGSARQQVLEEFLALGRVSVVPFDEVQATEARRAAIRYGRGTGSRARLNLGDCYSYALASVTGRPLLCKGDDFQHTDLRLAA
jgi:ribonuclease VapC